MTSQELEEKLSQISMDDLFCIYISDDTADMFYEYPSLGFSESFYLEHKSIVDSFVKKYCSYPRNGSFLSFLKLASPHFMSKDILESIRDNHTLKEVDFYGCELSKEAFDIMKENPNLSVIDSLFVCSELRDCYDIRLGATVNREIHGFLRVKDLLYSDDIHIYGDLKEAELIEICQLLSKRKVYGTISFHDMRNGSNIKKIMDVIDDLEQDGVDKTQYQIVVSDRSSFLYDVFVDQKQNSRICVFTKTDEVTDMNVYIQVENKIRELFENYNVYQDLLSPLEKVIFLHQMVSSFRNYKKEGSDEDWRNSRLLHKLLFSDQIVCAGFSFLLSDLGSRFDLPILELEATANHSTTDDYNHMNNIVFLDDDKYDIHGVYLLDTTADNNQLNIFIFNHCLLTPDEYRHHPSDLYTAGFSLLGVDDFDMFSKRIKNHREEGTILSSILKNYYPDHSLFQYVMSDSDVDSFYLMHLEDLFQMSRNMKVSPICDEKFSQAITHLEEVLHPELKDYQVQEKVQFTMDFYRQRNQEIFGDTSRTPLAIQKKL